VTEAVGLPQEQQQFLDQHPELGFRFLVVLSENNFGLATDGDNALSYWQSLGSPGDLPVLADPQTALTSSTPWSGNTIPGKCVLSPAMEILHCYAGHGNEEAFDAVLEHAS